MYYIDNNFYGSMEKPVLKTIFFYPGGKSRAIKKVLALYPNTMKKLVSHFLGGGSIEVAVAGAGVEVHGFDIFEPLVITWQEILKDAFTLVSSIRGDLPMTSEHFYYIQKVLFPKAMEDKNHFEVARLFYLLNKCSFGSMALSGGFAYQEHLTPTALDRAEGFTCPNLSVGLQSFADTLDAFPDDFTYLDPPYYLGTSSTLYGNKGSTHKDFDHNLLYDKLKSRSKWIMSYNNAPDILDMYKDFRIIVLPKWSHRLNPNPKEYEEILVVSNDFPEIKVDGS